MSPLLNHDSLLNHASLYFFFFSAQCFVCLSALERNSGWCGIVRGLLQHGSPPPHFVFWKVDALCWMLLYLLGNFYYGKNALSYSSTKDRSTRLFSLKASAFIPMSTQIMQKEERGTSRKELVYFKTQRRWMRRRGLDSVLFTLLDF